MVKLLRALARRNGGGLRAARLPRRPQGWVDVKAADINDYLKDVGGRRLLGQGLPHLERDRARGRRPRRTQRRRRAEDARRRASGWRTAVVEIVARYLNNTPAVCRASYIDPRVFDRFDSGATIKRALKREISETEPGEFPDREAIEAAVLDLLS